ncbi:TPA: BppU family phage baseplate upper protein [Bacillus cereus]
MAEILKIREITIDTMQHKEFNVKEEELKLIRFYQNDLNSAKLLINVTHDKVVTDFSSATSVQIAFLKPDCKRVFQDVQNVNQMQGKYYVVLSTQTLIAYGNVIAQLRFTFPNNKVIETCKFAFTVDESIMSDDAMKSTNEFPVIQKAIEAGKKLEGVDIDGIIAAGELAKGAVKKSGDTMTGNLDLDVTSSTKAIRATSGGVRQQGLFFDPSGDFGMYDWASSKGIFKYWKANNLLEFLGNVNVYKKTEIYNGFTTGEGKAISRNDTDLNDLIEAGQYTGQRMKNTPENSTAFFYVEVIRYGAADAYRLQRATNLSGNTIKMYFRVLNNNVWTPWMTIADTTNMQLDISAPNGDASLQARSGEDILAKVLGVGRGFRTFYAAGSALNTPNTLAIRGVSNMHGTSYGYAIGVTTDNRVWSNFINGTTWSGWKCVNGNDKDGRANINLTADAELFTGNTVIADRRGNTVTLRAPFRKKSGGNTTPMFTLPVDMRPTLTVLQNVSSIDGVQGLFVINSNGEVWMQDLGSSSVTGKSFYITSTYVTN